MTATLIIVLASFVAAPPVLTENSTEAECMAWLRYDLDRTAKIAAVQAELEAIDAEPACDIDVDWLRGVFASLPIPDELGDALFLDTVDAIMDACTYRLVNYYVVNDCTSSDDVLMHPSKYAEFLVDREDLEPLECYPGTSLVYSFRRGTGKCPNHGEFMGHVRSTGGQPHRVKEDSNAIPACGQVIGYPDTGLANDCIPCPGEGGE